MSLIMGTWTVRHEAGIAGMIDEVLQDEDEFNHGNMDGEDCVRVGASYLERELTGLQQSDDSVIDLQTDNTDSENENGFPPKSSYNMPLT
ncbi:hypothetical protein POJ06DRAFT_270063 [Lipomyces tetrasporus]|uniref:Uncharacterized protein n=1 Tax=Lipomyces tetrasporus TaxID=54092 RepID=A0AAD7QL16_9ASCO|nr:uncharacterized protein POJ06DRAFT_271609 [Lipomyces tetrasporus]XP_056041537.1 uncharacterized protein POJ06DRAFT_270063 [Lipomyces tetrasporus]KAJ8097242.1 hypothetical protein POJ06DRAFT_271609 [Lipomyces tetrasporus]KAJ8098087.1 hypothetical protein POJ06DRAFT_270063 [Lipomyces tetrasporus]